MKSSTKAVFLMGALFASVPAIAQAKGLSLKCVSAPSDSGIETKVQIEDVNPESSSDRWTVRIVRSDKTASFGYMAYHGGLGITTRAGNYEVWLYTGFDQTNDPMKLNVGGLTYADFGLSRHPVVCKNLAGIDRFMDRIPSEIPCGGVVGDSTGTFARVAAIFKQVGRDQRQLDVAYQAETKEGAVSQANDFVNIGMELPFPGAGKIKVSVLGKQAGPLEGALILPTLPSAVKLKCMID